MPLAAVAVVIKMSEPNNTNPLAILLAAAAALSVGSPATATENSTEDIPSTDTSTRASVRLSEYDEDALPTTPLDGDRRRYHVQTQQFRLDTAGNRGELTLNGTHEIMSGSSPWFVLPDADHRPVQVMSGATIRESRQELQVAWVRDPSSPTKTTWNASYSNENDYHATAVGFEHNQPLSSMLTLGYGGSFSHDLIDPYDAASFARIDHAEKNTSSAFASLAWVLNRSAVLQSGVQLTQQHGFLSDPYKLVYIGTGIVHDARPDQRTELAWLARYRYAVIDWDAALHADYRFAWDTWGARSHTAEVSWYQSLRHGWRLVPSVRYYSQTEADFYAPFFDSAAGTHYFSSDYRLGTYGAFSAQLNVRKSIGTWELSIGAQRYHSSENYALGGRDAAIPALVSFTRVFIGFDRSF